MSPLFPHGQNRSAGRGFALPAVLFMMLVVTSVMMILSRLSRHGIAQISIDSATDDTFFVAEGAVNKQLADLSVQGNLWVQRPVLADVPDGYTEYSPASYASSNGIPPCSGIGCHRDMYPVPGGLLKNLGPVNSDGDTVDEDYSITEQLDPDDLPTPDLTLNGVQAWTQVERLEEGTPDSSTVGGNLSNGVAEGGNARTVRFRITGISTKTVRGRSGYATVVVVAEMPPS